MQVLRGASALTTALALAAAVGCGDELGVSGGLTLVPTFLLGEASVGCAEAPGVRELEVTLLDPTGVAPRAGYPRTVACGDVIVDGPSGPAVVILRAVGTLDGDPDATLFRTREEVSLPDGEVSVQLRPEVAFLTLDWNFGDRALEPCTDEVDRIRVIVSAAGGGNNVVSTELGCDARPLIVESPLALAPHTIQVRAISSGGFPIYAHTAQRVFDRGPNAYTAVLAPSGGQVLLDWQFELQGQTIAACDDSQVSVMQIEARVQGLLMTGGGLVPDGSEPIVDRLDCAAPRPAAFRPARFVAGRELELELIGRGAHRFRSVQRLTMPSGDALLDLSVLEAVGTATGSVQIVTQSCAGPDVTVDLRPDGGSAPAVSLALSAPDNLGFEVPNLPYGRYRVTLSDPASGGACPPRTLERVVDATETSWGVLEL